MIVGLVGEPGAGKTTIASYLQAKDVGICPISISKLIPEDQRTKVLADEAMVRRLVAHAIAQAKADGGVTFLIDAAPRTLGQVWWLYNLAHYSNTGLAFAFILPEPRVVVKRLIERDREDEDTWVARARHYNQEMDMILQYAPEHSMYVSSSDSKKNAESIYRDLTGRI